MPLSTLVTMREVNGPEFTTRFNEYRAAQINGVLMPGYSTRQGMRALEQVFKETMPPDMGFDYSGMSYQEKVAEEGIPPAAVFGFSLLVVFLLLAAQYESWTLPFGVLLGTPIAVLGAVGALWVGRFELNVFSQIGLVMVIGLAAKNAILIVEFAKEEYERGASLVDAALAAARLRLRPILMTAFAFILGVVPLVMSTGAGANSRRVLGVTVMGGMLAATVIAIFIIPVTFYVSERFGRRPSSHAAMPDALPAPIAGGQSTRGHDAVAKRPDHRRHRRRHAAGRLRDRTGLQATRGRGAVDVPRPGHGGSGLVRRCALVGRVPGSMLKALIAEALRNNYDVAIAAARVQEARAGFVRAPIGLLPVTRLLRQRVEEQHDARRARWTRRSRRRPPATSTPPPSPCRGSSTSGAESVARTRRPARTLLATEDARRGVWLTLVSDLAQAYFELLALDVQLQIARSSTAGVPGHVRSLPGSLQSRRRLEAGDVARARRARRGAGHHSRSWRAASSPGKTRSASCWARSRARFRAASRCTRSPWCRRCRRGCRRRSWSGGPIFARRSSSSWPPTLASESPRRSSFRSSA